MTPPQALRKTMNGKPVLWREARSVLNTKSDQFREKLLCDGIVFNLGDACAYSCAFCYVEAILRYQAPPLLKAHNQETGESRGFSDVVIRRKNAIEILRRELLGKDGESRYPDPSDHRVVYSSTTVDVAANIELLRETAEACNLILDHTGWQIRLLSKSHLLRKLVEDKLIPEKHHQRLILGFSTGTLDDRVAKAFESGTALVSKRIESLHWLQDRGLRTFGMICPSLPRENYRKFSDDICAAIQADRCEQVWAEVINVRGDSLTRTLQSLGNAGLHEEAERLQSVSGPGKGQAWEQYARDTFLAHTKNVPEGKLRFLQYIDGDTAEWWAQHRERGAVLLGKTAVKLELAITPETAPLTREDKRFLRDREKIVDQGIRASIAASKALFEIHQYEGGRLWKREFQTFEAYCRARWEYGKSHSYRLVNCGEFMTELERLPEPLQSPNGDWMPKNEAQIRPLLSLPKEERLPLWKELVNVTPANELTSLSVRKKVKLHAGADRAGRSGRIRARSSKNDRAGKLIEQLRDETSTHENGNTIAKLLDQIDDLIGR